MDIKKLTVILIGIGTLITVGAFIWWNVFYSQVTGTEMSIDKLRCLYTSSGQCGFIASLARLSGGTPYNPTFFWIGIIVLGAGIILKYSLKEEQFPSDKNGDDLKK